MPSNMVRSSSSASPHTTTVDSAVLGLIVYLVGSEIEGLYETTMERAEQVVQGEVEDDSATDSPQQKLPRGAKHTFDHKAEVVLHLKVTPYYNVVLPPVIKKLRSSVIERVHQLTDLRVHAVHIHIAALRPT